MQGRGGFTCMEAWWGSYSIVAVADKYEGNEVLAYLHC